MAAVDADDVFVGRADLVAALTETVPRGRARIADAFGVAGIGKSRLIERVRREWTSRHAGIDVALALPPSAPTSVRQNYYAFLDAVDAIAVDLAAQVGRQRAYAEFSTEITQIEARPLVEIDVRSEVLARGAEIGDNATVGGVTVDAPVDADAAAGAWAGRARAVASSFARHFGPGLKRKPLVVSFDEYDELAGSDLARWILQLVAQLPNTLVVIGRTPRVGEPPARGEPQELRPFTRDEIAELLARHTATQPAPAVVDTVHEWSGGHPATAAIAVRLLAHEGALDAATVAARLRELPDDLSAARAKIAKELVASSAAASDVDAVAVSAIPRRFDEPLLAALLAAPATDVVDRLVAAEIVERVGKPADGVYRVHSYLREPLLSELGETRRKELHANAASHLYELLLEDEPELAADACSYDAWYRYEQPEWQAQLREWLYHQRAATRTDRELEQARLAFVRIVLDAFWWWECYVKKLGFCDDLVADWERTNGDDDLVADLRLFLASYPPGWRKQGAGSWDDVEAALASVKSACGLSGDADMLSGAARHTRALLDNFLAHAHRYRSDGDRARAAAYYDEATRLFASAGDDWELAWTLFELAELHVDTGDLDAARGAWHRSVEIAVEQDDWELTANLHRLRADVRWRSGDRRGALESHARAVLHAYLFQCRTPSHRPDEYTAAFYDEQVERLYERLHELRGAELDGAVADIGGVFGTTGDAASPVAADWRALQGTLLPRRPEEGELRATRSDLTRRIDVLAEKLGPDVARDLAGATA